MTSANRGSICVGIDVGGTFTDCVLTEGPSSWRAKAPTTTGRIGDGVLAAAELAAERRGSTLAEILPRVDRFGLGTTAVTNVLASRTGRRVGLLTTRGFEDMLPFSRGARVVDGEGWLRVPEGIVDPELIVGIDERIDRSGTVLRPICDEDVVGAARRLVVDHGVDVLVVSYLWSFLNPVHEEKTVAAIGAELPGVLVISGADLHPAPREYERTTFAALNAYVSGALDGITELDTRLRELGLRHPLLLVHSGGGSITVAEARRRPLGLAVSGPAAGVAASAIVSRAAGVDNVITCDMGGTSFDVSVITAGRPARRTRGEIAGVWTALPVIDVESIGSGGGSVAWRDARGMLRVGPRSAGAVPGPACYGRGGTAATVTDALVVLGFIHPDRFLGGDYRLDADAARSACATLGDSLGLSAEDAAWAIRTVALADMAKATRSRMSVLGLDPRDHALLSYGGSGSLFTPEIARAVGVPRVLVPELASVLSAFGAATADVRRERIRSVVAPMPVDPAKTEAVMRKLDDEVRSDLSADGILPVQQSISFEVDMRFVRQVFEIQLPVPASFDEATNEFVLAAFHEEYGRRYGQGSIVLGAHVEMVAIRAVGTGHTVQADLHRRADVAEDDAAKTAGRQQVRLQHGRDGLCDVDVYLVTDLRCGHRIEGPALVYGSDTTVWVPSDTTARLDSYGTLLLDLGQPGRTR